MGHRMSVAEMPGDRRDHPCFLEASQTPPGGRLSSHSDSFDRWSSWWRAKSKKEFVALRNSHAPPRGLYCPSSRIYVCQLSTYRNIRMPALPCVRCRDLLPPARLSAISGRLRVDFLLSRTRRRASRRTVDWSFFRHFLNDLSAYAIQMFS